MSLRHIQNLAMIMRILYMLIFTGVVPYGLLHLWKCRNPHNLNNKVYLIKMAAALTLTLQNLGPTFIKLGQVLATRGDLVGSSVSKELENLQDKLPPFSKEVVKMRLKEALGEKLDDVFRHFNYTPVAAASVAQVHYAELHDGSKVAVKILRPNIDARFNKDLEFLSYLQTMIEWFLGNKAKRLRLHAVISALKDLAKFELDLRYEASAADEIRHNMQGDDWVVIPKIYWTLTSQNIMVMAWVDGIPLKNIEALEQAGHNLQEVARKLAVIFFNQAYRDGFFHADLHPGNLFVNENGDIVMVDFGIVGMLSEDDRSYIAKIIYGFINRNYQEVADLHFQAGYIPKGQNPKLFALACRSVGEPIIGLPVNQISIAQLLKQLLEITKYFEMPTQPQLIMLQKTMVTLEGIGFTLYPDVNMWQLAEPWIASWAKQNFGFKTRTTKKLKAAIATLDAIPDLINAAHDAIQQGQKCRTENPSTELNESQYMVSHPNSERRKVLIFLLGILTGIAAYHFI